MDYHGELNANLGVTSSISISNRVKGDQMRNLVMNTLGAMSSIWGIKGSCHVEEDPSPKIKALFEMLLRSYCVMVSNHLFYQLVQE